MVQQAQPDAASLCYLALHASQIILIRMDKSNPPEPLGFDGNVSEN